MSQIKTANVLIVDDVTTNLAILAEIVKHAGYIARPVVSVPQARQAIHDLMPQLILLDISMPEISGYEFCEELKADVKTREIPVIFISAMTAPEDKKQGFRLGAVDYIGKPFDVDEVTLRLNIHLKNYTMQQEMELYNRRLQKMMSDQMKKISDDQKNLIFAFLKLTEAREDATGTHIQNVAYNAKLLAQSLQLSPRYENEISNNFIEEIEMAAPLHDIGKIGISDRILLKKGKLDEDEMEVVKTHSESGARILSEVYSHNEYSHYIKMAIDIAYYHHERWDGKGYPKGLKGNRIPLSARIAAIVDVYDALTREKCYKEAVTHEEAMRVINQESGKSFDPELVEVLNKVQKRLRRVDS